MTKMKWKKVPAELGCLEFFKVEVTAVQNFFYGGFSAFNMLVRMQLGSIPAAACSLKQYLYLNNVDKLNVIFNV